MNNCLRAVVILAVLTSFVSTVSAQAGLSEARGKVTDPEGNPLKGVTVTFRNTANEKAVYTVKTDKKGRYFLDSLVYYNTGDWAVSAEYEGYVTTHRSIESRTQQSIVIKEEENVVPGTIGNAIPIRAFGEATVDIVMTPIDQIAEQAPVVEAVAPAEEVPATPAPPKESPSDAAYRLAAAGNLEGALEQFDKAIEKNPDDAELIENHARVLYQAGRFDDAEQEARRASEIDPTNADPLKIVYSVQVSTEDYEGAGQTLDRLHAMTPEDLWVAEQMAFLATRQGDRAAAIEAYEGLVAIDPDNTQAWATLGGLYAEAGQPGKSSAAYQKVVELDPSNAYQTFFNIGALIENQAEISPEDNDKAIAAFRKAVEIKDDYAQAHYHLAMALLRKGDRAGARGSLERYLEVAPDASNRAQVEAMVKALSN